MKAKILSTKLEGDSTSFLCEISLKDYVENLPTSFWEYDIQRGLVSNVYLDKLIDTILLKSTIPPITLVSEDFSLEKDNLTQFLEVKHFKILDGLQRTYRLKVIWDTILYFNEIYTADLLNYSKLKLSRDFGNDLQSLNSTTLILDKIINYFQDHGCDKDELIRTFSENKQWFIIWVNISPEKQVEKMLVLNAGHKVVPIRHQLELLFLNLIPYFNKHKNLKLMREKEQSSTFYANKRSKNEFHFAHLISSVLSFSNGKTITTNASLINKLQDSDRYIDDYQNFFTYDFLDEMIDFIMNLDELLEIQYGGVGTQWLGRETVIVGIFGALGKIYQEEKSSYSEIFNKFINIVKENPEVLNLDNYINFRNSMNLSKVNIGNVSKKAVFEGVYNLIKNDITTPIDWNSEDNI